MCGHSNLGTADISSSFFSTVVSCAGEMHIEKFGSGIGGKLHITDFYFFVIAYANLSCKVKENLRRFYRAIRQLGEYLLFAAL